MDTYDIYLWVIIVPNENIYFWYTILISLILQTLIAFLIKILYLKQNINITKKKRGNQVIQRLYAITVKYILKS